MIRVDPVLATTLFRLFSLKVDLADRIRLELDVAGVTISFFPGEFIVYQNALEMHRFCIRMYKK